MVTADAPLAPPLRSEGVRRAQRLLEAAAGGTPGIAVVQGGRGAGKTHVAGLIAEDARRRGFRVAEVDAAVAALTSIIEPVIIVFMGTIIGGILIAMYLPMFSIFDQIK